MKALHIHGRRWFQRTYGNTYNTCAIYVDGERVHKTPRQYGYEHHYATIARGWLKRNDYLPGIVEHDNGSGEPLWRYCERKGIKFIDEVDDVSRERDL